MAALPIQTLQVTHDIRAFQHEGPTERSGSLTRPRKECAPRAVKRAKKRFIPSAAIAQQRGPSSSDASLVLAVAIHGRFAPGPAHEGMGGQRAVFGSAGYGLNSTRSIGHASVTGTWQASGNWRGT